MAHIYIIVLIILMFHYSMISIIKAGLAVIVFSIHCFILIFNYFNSSHGSPYPIIYTCSRARVIAT
jgi:hypothetical protein